jgi:drug/metabolite transporter (DMT)-like permease
MPRLVAHFLLLATALSWGSVFVAQHWAAGQIGPFGFNGLRYLLGTILLAPLAFWEWRRAPLNLRSLGFSDWALLLGLGLVLGLGSVAQQAGIARTSLANAGFLTTLYVPMVPLIALLALRQPVRRIVWPAVVLCLVGTYLLAGLTSLTLHGGDAIIMVGALFFALHILIIQAFMARHPAPFQASCLQALVACLMTLPLGLASEGLDLSVALTTLKYTGYAAFMSVFLGFTLQLIAQRYSSPSTAAILLSMEAVFAAMFGWLILSQALDAKEILGCLLIFVGVVLVEAWPRPKAEPAR